MNNNNRQDTFLKKELIYARVYNPNLIHYIRQKNNDTFFS